MIKDFLRILMNPETWIRNYRTNKTIDSFYRTIIDNQDEVEIVHKDECHLVFVFRNRAFTAWVSGHFYAYLSRTYECVIDDNKVYRHRHLSEVEGALPSRITQLDFYETFDRKPYKPKDKVEFLESVINASNN